MSKVSLITFSLAAPFPESGKVTVLVRLKGKDKNVVDIAADQLGVSQALLMRTLIVRGAEKILEELGVELQYEPTI
jgi:hypothetical protein